MEHLVEVLRIIDGAVNLNKDKVVSYAKMLAEKLEIEGEVKAAERVKEALEKTAYAEMTPSAAAHLGKVPVDSESRMSLADERMYSPGEVNVFLEPSVVKTIEEFLGHIKGADKLAAEGVGIAPTMLIYGPPGCGKTELGRYIAARLQLPLIIARTDGLISSFLGNTAKNLRTLFMHVMGRPCILFLDEFDALAKLRDDEHELGELKRVVVSLLQNIDALDNDTIVLAATNHEHLLDPAIWRRFAYKIMIDKPTEGVRKELFAFFLNGFSEESDFSILAAISDGITGADIRQAAENAKRESILMGMHKVSLEKLSRDLIMLGKNDTRSGDESLMDQIERVRNINQKIFTYERLSRIFGVSVGKVHYLLKQSRGKPNGRKPTTAN